jgi:hypothetical protein
MKALIAAAALAVSAVALAAPAHADPRDAYAYNDRGAQSRGEYRGDHRGDYRGDHRGQYRDAFSRDDLVRMESRIDRGYRSGRLTRVEARYLSSELGQLRNRARNYWQTSGMSWRERQDLDARYHRLQERIQRQLRDDDTRYSGDYRGQPRRY